MYPMHKVKHGDFAAQISNEQINVEVGSTDNCIFKNIRVTVGPNQPSVQWVPVVSSQAVKWPRCEVDDTLLSSAEDKNDYSYTATLPCAFTVQMGETLPIFLPGNDICNGQGFPSSNSGQNIEFVVRLRLVHLHMGTVFQNNTSHVLPHPIRLVYSDTRCTMHLEIVFP
jgi:hypothetical protein